MRMTRFTKWGLVCLFWLGWSAACTSFSYSFRVSIHKPALWTELSLLYFAAYGLWGPVFTPIAVFLVRHFPLESGKLARSLAVHIMAAPSIAITHACICAPFDRI